MNRVRSALEFDTDAPRPAPAAAPRPAAARRWHWYHAYFLLALVDLAVIVASLMLYHRANGSFAEALQDLADIDGRQALLRELRTALVDLNAPGNDIFESRDTQGERARFARLRSSVEHALQTGGASLPQLTSFVEDFHAMVAIEERIFSAFDGLAALPPESPAEPTLLAHATALMAAMDRAQAEALRSLLVVEEELQHLESVRLRAYGDELATRASDERFFFGMLALVLAGVFVYGRKLHAMNERMLADRQRAHEERQARLAAIGEVCATVAHGIRNPLAGISAAAQNALAESDDPNVCETLADVISEADRLAERTRQLLDFSRPLQPELHQGSLEAAVDRIVTEMSARAARVGARLSRTGELQLPAARFDPRLMHEALAELTDNALAALPQGGEVTLDLKREGADLVVRVHDTGIGIPRSVRSRIFELFFTTKKNGTGLGLATVRKIVEAQGSRIALEASGPDGTTFTVRVPAA